MKRRPERRVGITAGFRSLLAALVVALTALATGACTKDDTLDPIVMPPGSTTTTLVLHRGGTLRMGVTGLDTFDPADVSPTTIGSMVAIDLLFESLSVIDVATNRAAPALAAKWNSNAELTVWSFTLRSDAAFSDGTAVTAADVKFSLERVARRGNASIAGARLDMIAGYGEFTSGLTPDLAGIALSEDGTLAITTSQPYADLPELLASPLFGVVSKQAVDTLKAEFALKPVGSGPYVIAPGAAASASPSGGPPTGNVRLERAKGVNANLDAIELVRFPDDSSAYQAVKDGKIDWARVPFDEVEQAAERFDSAFVRVSNAELFYGMNLKNPAFGDTRFRQAIVKSINREKLVALMGGSVPMNGVVPKSVPGAPEDACGDACKYDVEAAKALLGLAFPEGNVPTISINFYSDPSDAGTTLAQQKVAQAIHDDLQIAGIPSALDGRPFEEYRSFAIGGSQQLFTYGWVGLAPVADSFLAPLFISSSQDNVTGFAVAAVDEAVSRARATADPTARAQQYGDIERMVMGETPLVPLSEYRSIVFAERVNDLKTRFDGTFPVEQVWVSAE